MAAAPRLSSGQPPRQDAAPPARRRVGALRSELGGLFFLINLALYLGLYGDFSTPGEPGIDLSIWDFVTLVSRDLVGDEGNADPVWALLAELAGRALDEPPGVGFTPPSEWRLPPAWLRAFPEEEPWAFHVQGGRLVLQHPSGFVVMDVPASADPRAQAEAEAHGYGRDVVEARAEEPVAEPAEPLARWLGWLLPYVRVRLSRALGVEARALERTLCAVPARIHATATHLDVIMSLADLPIEVRRAGLDRDPWWIPAAGRYVAFHFE